MVDVASNAGFTAAPARSETGYFARYGMAARRNGYSVLPLQTADKSPLEDIGWRKWCWDLPELDETRHFARTAPEAGMGLACGRGAMAFDVDLDDRRASDALRGVIEDICGPTPLVRVGRAPRVAMVYRTAEPIFPIRLPLFDILGLNCQLACYGLHPTTGNEYRWIGEGAPHDTPLSELPAVTQDQCVAIGSEYMQRLYGARFRGFVFDIDSAMIAISLSSRTTMLKQLARRLFRGKDAAFEGVRKDVLNHRLPAGFWGSCLRADVRDEQGRPDFRRRLSHEEIFDLVANGREGR